MTDQHAATEGLDVVAGPEGARRSAARSVTGGVDTHADTHHAAALDNCGRLLGTAQFPATAAGYDQLAGWMGRFGPIDRVGVEGTGSYGAGLTRHLRAAELVVVEVNRPNRAERRRRGKSDPIDAEAAARAVLSGQAAAIPKDRTGIVEAIRALRVARAGAVKAHTAALNQLKDLITTAPETLRATLRGHSLAKAATLCARLRPDHTRLHEPTQATKLALRTVAARIHTLAAEARQAEKTLTALITKAAPRTTALFGAGPDTAGQLLTTAGDNPTRLRSEPAFAHLCAAAPIPASSGKTQRHRLNPAGDRNANRALHTIAIVRLRWCPTTRAYAARRTTEGLTKREIIRCLKRYIARQLYPAIQADLADLQTST